MSTFWIASLASLATLLGGWGVVRFLQGRAQFMRLLSCVAAGYLLSVTVVRIIPECLDAKGREINAYWVLAGYLLRKLAEFVKALSLTMAFFVMAAVSSVALPATAMRFVLRLSGNVGKLIFFLGLPAWNLY